VWDNFTGGIITSLAWQIRDKKKGQIDLLKQFHGSSLRRFYMLYYRCTYIEKYPGEKLNRVSGLQKEYLKQIQK